MRPDEHKKRKNAQYKRKHGITDKSDGSDKKEKSKDAHRKAHKHEDSARQPAKLDKSKPQGDTESDSDEQVFRRRGLVSNWERYDDLPSDDDSTLPTHRGEDFNKLLASAGGASAQFRFHDEESWDGITDCSATMSRVLSMNFESLHQSLSCIPLHQCLGVAEDLFSDIQLDEMNKMAADNHALLKSIHEKGTVENSNPKMHFTANDSEKDNQKYTSSDTNKPDKLLKDSDLRNLPVKHDIVSTNKQPSDSLHKDASQDTLAESDTKLHLKMGLNDNLAVHKNEKLTQKDDTGLEDDLDMLLSLDKPKTTLKTLENIHKEGDSTVKNTLVNGTDVLKEIKTTKSPPAIVVKPSEKKENLEDWLDSMLDD